MDSLAITFGFSPETSQVVPDSAIITFYGKGLFLGLNMLIPGNEFGITCPVVGTISTCTYSLYFFPELDSGF